MFCTHACTNTQPCSHLSLWEHRASLHLTVFTARPCVRVSDRTPTPPAHAKEGMHWLSWLKAGEWSSGTAGSRAQMGPSFSHSLSSLSLGSAFHWAGFNLKLCVCVGGGEGGLRGSGSSFVVAKGCCASCSLPLGVTSEGRSG